MRIVQTFAGSMPSTVIPSSDDDASYQPSSSDADNTSVTETVSAHPLPIAKRSLFLFRHI